MTENEYLFKGKLFYAAILYVYLSKI